MTPARLRATERLRSALDNLDAAQRRPNYILDCADNLGAFEREVAAQRAFARFESARSELRAAEIDLKTFEQPAW